MRTLRQNSMLLLEYLYKHNAGYLDTITGSQMRTGCPPMTDEEYQAASLCLDFSGYVDLTASNDGGHYSMTSKGIEAIEAEINSRSLWKRRGDDMILVVIAGLIGVFGAIVGTLIK